MARMGIDAATLSSLVGGTAAGTYGGELLSMKRYVSLSYGCSDVDACSAEDFGAMQWLSSTPTLNPPLLISAEPFICDPNGYIEQIPAMTNLGFEANDTFDGETLKLLYGEDLNQIQKSLLLN